MRKEVGIELLRRRLALQKSDTWIEDILGEISTPRLSRASNCRGSKSDRREAAEAIDFRGYFPGEIAKFQESYDKALAECEHKEPECPEGVTAWSSGTGTYMHAHVPGGCAGAFLEILKDGTIKKVLSWKDAECSPEVLEYAATLSRHLTLKHKHKNEDKQHKLDAVKAAEEAWENAERARSFVWASTEEARLKAVAAANSAVDALNAARREACI